MFPQEQRTVASDVVGMDVRLHRTARIPEAVSGCYVAAGDDGDDRSPLSQALCRRERGDADRSGRLARRASRARRGSGSRRRSPPPSTSTGSTPSSRQTASGSAPANGAFRPSAIESGVDRHRLPGARAPRAGPPSSLRLDGDHRARRDSRRRDPGDEPAAADRDDDHVDVRHVLEDLEPDRALAGHGRAGRRTGGRASGRSPRRISSSRSNASPGRPPRGRPRRRSRAPRRPFAGSPSRHMTTRRRCPRARSVRERRAWFPAEIGITPRAALRRQSDASFVEDAARLEGARALEELRLQEDAAGPRQASPS